MGTLLLAATMAPAGGVRAQDGDAGDPMSAIVSLVGGAFQYDLSGTGTVPFAGLRVSLPLASWILTEPGLTYAAYTSQGDERIPLLVPEVELQGRMDLGRVDPFLGLGLGGMFDLRESRDGEPLVVSSYAVSAGARGWLGHGWTARGELRVRAVDGFTGSVAEWTVGIGRAF